MPDSERLPGMRAGVDRAGVAVFLARLAVGVFFVYVGAKKTVYPGDFAKVIKTYGILPLDPPYFLNATAVILPWLEIVAGLALVTGIALRAGAIIIAGLLASFTPAILLRALAFPDYVSGAISFAQIQFDCGCGVGPEIVWEKLTENTMLFLLTIPIILYRAHEFRLGPRGARVPAPG